MSGEVVAGQIGLNKALELSDDFISRAPIDAKFQVLTNHSPVALSWLSKAGSLGQVVRCASLGRSKEFFTNYAEGFSAVSKDVFFLFIRFPKIDHRTLLKLQKRWIGKSN